jgi:hypothetical protein
LPSEILQLDPGRTRNRPSKRPKLLARYDAGAAQWHIPDGTYRVALGASGTALLYTAAASLGERFPGE